MKLSDIADLIKVKTYLLNTIDNATIPLTKNQTKDIQAKIKELDTLILKFSLELDLSFFLSPQKKILREFNSTRNVEVVAQEYINKKDEELNLYKKESDKTIEDKTE